MGAPTDKTAHVTIGTMDELGCIGVPLDVALGIMRAWDKAVKGKCRSCGLKLVGCVHDGGFPGPKRSIKREGLSQGPLADRQLCDACALAAAHPQERPV